MPKVFKLFFEGILMYLEGILIFIKANNVFQWYIDDTTMHFENINEISMCFNVFEDELMYFEGTTKYVEGISMQTNVPKCIVCTLIRMCVWVWKNLNP
jgi:hypothetical protein